MPTTATFQKFQFQLYDRIQERALGKTEDEVVRWVDQAWDKDVSYERLGKVRSAWTGVNRKLRVAFSNILSGELSRSIYEENKELVMKSKKRLTALQILRRLNAHLQTNPEMKELYGIQDLMEVKWLGDARKQNFRHSWNVKVQCFDGDKCQYAARPKSKRRRQSDFERSSLPLVPPLRRRLPWTTPRRWRSRRNRGGHDAAAPLRRGGDPVVPLIPCTGRKWRARPCTTATPVKGKM